jgi:hypothetical protein
VLVTHARRDRLDRAIETMAAEPIFAPTGHPDRPGTAA